MPETRASRALVAALAEDEELAERIRKAIHRTQLWKYTSGRRRPDIDVARRIEVLTDKRVPMEDWALDPDGNPIVAWPEEEDDAIAAPSTTPETDSPA